MANIFSTADAPTEEPEVIIVGDYKVWRKSGLALQYPSASYFVKYISRDTGSGGTHEFSVTGTVDGDDYLFEITSAVSATFHIEHFHWQLEVTRNSDSNRAVLETGSWDIITDLDNAVDPRSHAQIMISKIESILEGKADADVASYSINGRSLTKMSFQDLQDARDFYRREYAKEVQRERAKRGDNTGATVLVRF